LRDPDLETAEAGTPDATTGLSAHSHPLL